MKTINIRGFGRVVPEKLFNGKFHPTFNGDTKFKIRWAIYNGKTYRTYSRGTGVFIEASSFEKRPKGLEGK